MQRLFEAPSGNYRTEQKYYLSLAEAAALRGRLETVMRRDPHSDAQRRYLITSVYFDTPGNRSYLGSLAGVEKRKKLRIRAYNHQDDYISLEYKEKDGNLSRKRQLRITPEDCRALLGGDPAPLLRYESDLAHSFYYDMRTNLYRPKTLVEYTRETYIHPLCNVRVTLDTNLCGSAVSLDLFSPRGLTPILARDVVLLEVKYCHFLPSFIADLLPRDCMPAVSNCKFARARAIQ